MANSDRIVGILLVAAAAGTLLAMGHHPSGAHSGALGPIVHGAMITLICVMAFGFAHFSLRRGLDRPLVLAGLVAFAVATFGHVGAATINGFAVPALAGRGHGAVGHDLFLFAWEMNQALAKLGVLAESAAFLLWSIDFFGRRTGEARMIGLAGIVAGLLPAALLAGGWIAMNVAGAFIAYGVQAAWVALVGLHLARGKLDEGSAKQPAG